MLKRQKDNYLSNRNTNALLFTLPSVPSVLTTGETPCYWLSFSRHISFWCVLYHFVRSLCQCNLQVLPLTTNGSPGPSLIDNTGHMDWCSRRVHVAGTQTSTKSFWFAEKQWIITLSTCKIAGCVFIVPRPPQMTNGFHINFVTLKFAFWNNQLINF